MVSPTLREDVQADEAAHLGPLVVLLGKDCADEAGECLASIRGAAGHLGLVDLRWEVELEGV